MTARTGRGGPTFRRVRARGGLLALVLLVGGGCVTGSPGSSTTVAPPTPSEIVSPTPVPAPPTADPTADTGGPGLDVPPDAMLAAEGGDPVRGQLGSYVWLERGSDAPWLPGAAITVGTGEPLSVTLVPDGETTGWSARYVPAGRTDPAGAQALGTGVQGARFIAPAPGEWTVEVRFDFAAGVGSASYFWQVLVR